jgi:outer membrane protein OmpA-like peptidoglycan-associated protein
LERTSLKKIGVLGVAMLASVGSALGGSSVAPADQRVARPSVESLENYTLLSRDSAHFKLGKVDLSTEERASLAGLANRLVQTRQAVIELRGYADGAGSTEQNVALSSERADVIQRLLIERGVAADRIVAFGLGAVDPAGPALNPDHQRVDIRVFLQATRDLSQRGAVVTNVVAKGASAAK